MIFTGGAIYEHMKTDHKFNKNKDSLLKALSASCVLDTFTIPPNPIPSIPGVPIILAQHCSAPGCTRFFLDPDILDAHVLVEHPDANSPEGKDCYLQEVRGDAGSLLFQVLHDELDAEGACYSSLTVPLYNIVPQQLFLRAPRFLPLLVIHPLRFLFSRLCCVASRL
jgi:hypothetical protein